MAVENHVTASSFADPADVRRFRAAKARGLSDEEAFKIGDNGVGEWGDDCSEGSGPSCALPPEVMVQNWGSMAEAKHQPVQIFHNNASVIALIKDRMPYLRDIHNGARIDLNPDTVRALGMEPPIMAQVIWRIPEADTAEIQAVTTVVPEPIPYPVPPDLIPVPVPPKPYPNAPDIHYPMHTPVPASGNAFVRFLVAVFRSLFKRR